MGYNSCVRELALCLLDVGAFFVHLFMASICGFAGQGLDVAGYCACVLLVVAARSAASCASTVLNARGMSNKAVALVGFIVTVSCACSTAICIVVFGLLALPLFSVALVWAAACLAGARTVYTVCATIATRPMAARLAASQASLTSTRLELAAAKADRDAAAANTRNLQAALAHERRTVYMARMREQELLCHGAQMDGIARQWAAAYTGLEGRAKDLFRAGCTVQMENDALKKESDELHQVLDDKDRALQDQAGEVAALKACGSRLFACLGAISSLIGVDAAYGSAKMLGADAVNISVELTFPGVRAVKLARCVQLVLAPEALLQLTQSSQDNNTSNTGNAGAVNNTGNNNNGDNKASSSGSRPSDDMLASSRDQAQAA